MNLPFEIGQRLWMPQEQPQRITKACPVCAGNLSFLVILGSGEQLALLCEACGKGFNQPTGVVQEWDYEPDAVPFEIAEVRSFFNDRWTLRSTTGMEHDFHDLYLTRNEALAVSAQRAIEAREHYMQSYQNTKKNLKNASWSVKYHRDKITELERQITWHRGRISLKEKHT